VTAKAIDQIAGLTVVKIRTPRHALDW